MYSIVFEVVFFGDVTLRDGGSRIPRSSIQQDGNCEEEGDYKYKAWTALRKQSRVCSVVIAVWHPTAQIQIKTVLMYPNHAKLNLVVSGVN